MLQALGVQPMRGRWFREQEQGPAAEGPNPVIVPTDPAAYVAALGIVLAAAALASYLPARRASAVDPVETLKAE